MAAASQALDLETARWAHLLQKAPPPSPHDLAPAWFPARPDKSPV
jgi:hypothetical protein